MASSSVLSPGIAVMLMMGSQSWDAIVRVRLPDQGFMEMVSPDPDMFVKPQAVMARWQSPPLVSEQALRVQNHSSQPNILVGQLLGAPKPLEQRRVRRFSWNWPVQIRWDRWPGHHIDGMSEDLSVTGCRCQIARALDENRDYTVKLTSPEQTWRCRAALLRQAQEDPDRWAVVMLWIPGEDTAAWQQWIARHTE